MAHWLFGVDSSYDELTPQEARRLKDNGIQVFAQCLWTGGEQPGPRVISLRNAKNAGIPKLVGYISVASHHGGEWHVNKGREGVPDDIWNALAKTPIDVELGGLTLGDHVAPALDRAVALGKRKDVYTNYNTWVNVLGNPVRPAGTGLWNAIWDDNPDFDFPRLRFGGWRDSEVWGEQWSGGTNIHGQFADRNQFRASALGLHIEQPPAPRPPMTPVPTPPFTAVLLRYTGTHPVYLAHLWHVPNPAALDALKRAGIAGPVVIRVVPPTPPTSMAGPPAKFTGLLLQHVGTPMVFFAQLWHIPNPATLDAIKRAGIMGPLDVKVA